MLSFHQKKKKKLQGNCERMRESFEDVKLQSYIITRNVSVHMLTTNKNNILTPSLEKYKTI